MTSSGKVRNVIRYSGHVQGVGFRATTISVARGLDLHGFVRNEPDGSVLVDVDGSKAELKELVRRVKTAMSGRIDSTLIDEFPSLDRTNGFRITY